MPCCDIFCRVIDNFGDAGVAWRVAQSLQRESPFCVRLIIDNVARLTQLVPACCPNKSDQWVDSIRIVRWDEAFEKVAVPADAVIEAFSCFLPAAYEEKIAERVTQGRPVSVIALDYLTAEDYAGNFHGLESPHPRYGYSKHFFFPGFTEKTGGLIVEDNYEMRRKTFTPEKKAALEHALHIPESDALRLFLFTYPTVDTAALAGSLIKSGLRIQALLAPGQAQETFFQACRAFSAKSLTCIKLPMAPQKDFDLLLWSSDVLIVRGEDSASRALLSGKPFFWTLYPQKEQLHIKKMEAFEKTLTDSFEPEALLRRNAVERALNEESPVPEKALLAYFQDIDAQQKGARTYARKCLTLPRAPRKIAKMLLDGLK